jgi:hypothetical protein
MHDDWSNKFSPTGQELVPAAAMPSIAETSAAMERGLSPTPAQQSAFGVEPTAPSTVLVPVKRDDMGNLVREDWGPRNAETGRLSADALRQVWEKEGTAAPNIAKVLAAEQSMLALAPSLGNQIASLPNDIQAVAADYLRLSPPGFNREDKRFGSFVDALSESQFETFRGWFANLSADEQTSILIAAGMK